MDTLELLRTFREVARRNSFAAAARALDLAPATVSKYVAELETRFHLRLFNRSTRHVSLTDAGQLLIEHSGLVVDLIDRAEDAMSDRAARPGGRLNLSAPHVLVQTALMRRLADFMLLHPDISINLWLTNQVADLAEDAIDLAFHVGPVAENSQIVRRLLRLEMVVAATPDYWREHGRPEHPRELVTHRTLAVAPPGETPHWHFSVGGKIVDLPLRAICTASDSSPMVPLALKGAGVIRGSRMLLGDWIALGRLEPLFGEYSPRNLWLHAAYAQRHHHSAALRALLDFLEVQMRRPAPGGAASGSANLSA
ncbi:MAG TPA: LysR substrate-binding domain-containing protein [Ottowia sp.]|uniref:LysR family transcriptional regulator n=1 Tax=Ottowia sp. TaxID=1898956 RepID=UPI002B87B972|nr:LysR substrate-binding domain-containing protein [Ottowia sp.]HMN21239.1 LysR substrate-binding domain-containing protein [Ottowia sp.]